MLWFDLKTDVIKKRYVCFSPTEKAYPNSYLPQLDLIRQRLLEPPQVLLVRGFHLERVLETTA